MQPREQCDRIWQFRLAHSGARPRCNSNDAEERRCAGFLRKLLIRRDKCVGEGRKPSEKRLTAEDAAYLDDTLREPMQPSSDRSRSPSRLGFSGGGDHPAVEGLPNLDAGIMRDVRILGRLPKEIGNAQTEEAKAERRLAERIRKSSEAPWEP